ncbi:unnamed protein product [Lactuca virosa]|uniref:HMA domain-containing protein n=1 Tax=Lactuca virosa TaxID=75947 RepID=A0AAU9N820_9ASTR|nr:unnamed protein product [Lactuca virosa]
MASKKSKNEDPAFTNFTIKVDVEGSWTKAVKKVLNSVQGVTNFRMENNGKVNISGYIDPTLLLKCGESRKNSRDSTLANMENVQATCLKRQNHPCPCP